MYLIFLPELKKILNDVHDVIESVFNTIARSCTLLGRFSEAIKILKKLKRMNDDDDEEDLFTDYYLIGFLYESDDNIKEALKWYKKCILVSLPEHYYDSSMNDFYHLRVDVVYMGLHRIAHIKFLQKDYHMANIILEEVCAAFENREDISQERKTSQMKLWEPLTGTLSEHASQAKELHQQVIPQNPMGEKNTSDEILSKVEKLKSSRLKKELKNLSKIGEKTKVLMVNGKMTQALSNSYNVLDKMTKEYQGNIKNILLREDRHDIMTYYKEYTNCFLHFNMHEEALELLMLGLKRHGYKMLHELRLDEYFLDIALVYASIGDYKRSSYYVILCESIRHKGSQKFKIDYKPQSERQRDVINAILSMNDFLQ